MTVISYPIPPYSNPPINSDYYQPRAYDISAITLGSTTLVTTSANHDFVIGQACRFIIPWGYGTTELNEMQGIVISIPMDDQVTITIDSSSFSTFIPGGSPQPVDKGTTAVPQILPIGDVNSGIISSTGLSNTSTNIPGSFINISPE